SKEDHLVLLNHCKLREIQFLSTAFDLDSVDFLIGLDLPYWKIPSGEITHVPYLERIAATGKPVFISTGMAYLGEIEFALDQFLRNGYSREFITILHCTTDYPARFSDLNLNAIRSLQAAFGTGVGYSDHSSGLEASVAAVALGATVIEKHFTVDRTLPGPDHRASLEPDELAGLVRAIRNVSAALGDGLKGPTEPELANRPIVRKGIYASRSIQAGDLLGPENLVCKRPVGKLPAELWSRVVGKKASRDFAMGESLEL
ncbi:MAG: N-acetylneuraminate synthase family protein, partial [Leptospiraceae bacterium]|nr:N-acetylneuraminate synthase family protein [Leptospiraceae bacterium]